MISKNIILISTLICIFFIFNNHSFSMSKIISKIFSMSKENIVDFDNFYSYMIVSYENNNLVFRASYGMPSFPFTCRYEFFKEKDSINKYILKVFIKPGEPKSIEKSAIEFTKWGG